MVKARAKRAKAEEAKPEGAEAEDAEPEEVKVGRVEPEIARSPRIVTENRTVLDIGGSLTWIVCIALAVAIIHFSCGAGTATGYVGEICSRGLNIWDYAGLICCSPIYLLYLIIASGGLRLW